MGNSGQKDRAGKGADLHPPCQPALCTPRPLDCPLPKVVVKEKPPMYRSKHDPKAPVTGSTFGTDRVLGVDWPQSMPLLLCSARPLLGESYITTFANRVPLGTNGTTQLPGAGHVQKVPHCRGPGCRQAAARRSRTAFLRKHSTAPAATDLLPLYLHCAAVQGNVWSAEQNQPGSTAVLEEGGTVQANRAAQQRAG